MSSRSGEASYLTCRVRRGEGTHTLFPNSKIPPKPFDCRLKSCVALIGCFRSWFWLSATQNCDEYVCSHISETKTTWSNFTKFVCTLPITRSCSDGVATSYVAYFRFCVFIPWGNGPESSTALYFGEVRQVAAPVKRQTTTVCSSSSESSSPFFNYKRLSDSWHLNALIEMLFSIKYSMFTSRDRNRKQSVSKPALWTYYCMQSKSAK